MGGELKPCPFCGYPARLLIKQTPTEKDGYIIRDFIYEYIVKCNRCRANVKYYKSKAAAVNAWNRRAHNSNDIATEKGDFSKEG